MEERKSTTIAPSIRVKDVQKSLDFYTKTLGLHESDKMTRKDGKIAHASVGYDAPILSLASVEDVFTSEVKDTLAKNKLGVGVEFRIAMNGSKKIDQFCSEVKAKGAKVITEPKTESWGDRLFTVADPDGYAITFSEHDANVTPEARNASMETAHDGKHSASVKAPIDNGKQGKIGGLGNADLNSPNKGKMYEAGKSPSPTSQPVKAGDKGNSGLNTPAQVKGDMTGKGTVDTTHQGKGQQAGKTPVDTSHQWKPAVDPKQKK